MPGYRTHMHVGLVTWALMLFVMTFAHYHVTWVQAAQLLFFTMLGSLVPDIDTRSKGRMVFYRFFILVSLVLMLFKWWNILAVLAAFFLLAILAPHRTIFHNVWFLACTVISAVLFARTISPSYATIILLNGIFFLSGAISHILLDVGWRRFLRFRW